VTDWQPSGPEPEKEYFEIPTASATGVIILTASAPSCP
jgi:hypothetical protein